MGAREPGAIAARVRVAVALVLAMGCSAPAVPFEPGVLTGSVVRSTHTEIEVASDFADSATTMVRGVDGVAMGLRVGDRVRVERRDESVGKADPMDWDCAGRHCVTSRE